MKNRSFFFFLWLIYDFSFYVFDLRTGDQSSLIFFSIRENMRKKKNTSGEIFFPSGIFLKKISIGLKFFTLFYIWKENYRREFFFLFPLKISTEFRYSTVDMKNKNYGT